SSTGRPFPPARPWKAARRAPARRGCCGPCGLSGLLTSKMQSEQCSLALINRSNVLESRPVWTDSRPCGMIMSRTGPFPSTARSIMASNTLESLRTTIRKNYLPDENAALARLVGLAGLSADSRAAISNRAAGLVEAVRGAASPELMEIFLSEYGLSTREGVALMCLAEALLRVPDSDTIDDLIRDKIAPHDWSSHSGSSSIFVNASTWALMLTG